MEYVKNEKPVMVDPSAGYDLHQAVIQTNEAVQAAARAVERLAASVAAVYGGGVNADIRD